MFVFAKSSLFSQGIKNLLDAEPGLDVVGWEADPTTAIKKIGETKPDAILYIAENSCARPSFSAEHLLKLGVKAKIVELSLDDASVYVYQGEQLTVTEIGDLVSAI